MADDNKKKKKSTTEEKPEHNPHKHVVLDPILEAKERTAVLSFGRFNPPTKGHEKLASAVVKEAQARRATPVIYASHTQDRKKNPLAYDYKMSLLKAMLGSVAVKSSAKTILGAAKELQSKYTKLVVVVGGDRVKEFETLLAKYNGKEYKFDSIEVISAGDRDPDADGVTGLSASKMRAFAEVGNASAFKDGLPTKLSNRAEEIYTETRKGMGLMEEQLEEARQPLTIQQRRRRGMIMRKYRTKIKAARERAKRRMATPEKLKARAQRKARGLVRDRLMKNKKYSEMSAGEKIALDKRMARLPKSMIDRLARKQLPLVRRAEVQRLANARKSKTEETLATLNALFEEHLTKGKKWRNLFTADGKVNVRLKCFDKDKPLAEDFEADIHELARALDEIVDKTDPSNREWGTDELLAILKADTPGETR